MTELETVMTRLRAHTVRLKARSAAMEEDDDDRLFAESLALVSEAVLRVGRDVRFMRIKIAGENQHLD